MSTNEALKKSLLQKELKNHFTPEFLNRVDEVVIFNPLRKNEVCQIVEIEINKLNNRLEKLGYDIFVEKRVKSFISEVGFDEKYGARPIKRAIQEKIEDLISEEVLRGNVVEGGKYKLKIKNKTEIYIEEKGK